MYNKRVHNITQDGVSNENRGPSLPLRVAFGSQFGHSQIYDSTFMQAPPQSIARAPGAGRGLSSRARRLLSQAAEGDDAVTAAQLLLLMQHLETETSTMPDTNTGATDTLTASIRVCACLWK